MSELETKTLRAKVATLELINKEKGEGNNKN